MRRAIILAVIAFTLVLLVRLPARWLSPLLPHGMQCQQLDGSAWNGSCTGLTSSGNAVGDVTWNLQLLQLLRARLDLRLDLTGTDSSAHGEVALGFGGAVHGRDVTLDVPLTSALVSSLPVGAHARLQGTLARIEWTGKYLSELQGELRVQDLVGPRGQAFGSYQVSFAPGSGSDSADLPTGVVHDGGGPLQLEATLQLTHDPGYVVDGRVAPRPSASADIVDMLKYLGSADASGRRPFSLMGTF
ncbi:MAG TPA: type II secretion system protein N [Steroidobacteraceae bacterium]|nr:type II secretion system protein N [Steroidobacteraceae bacterium]